MTRDATTSIDMALYLYYLTIHSVHLWFQFSFSHCGKILLDSKGSKEKNEVIEK